MKSILKPATILSGMIALLALAAWIIPAPSAHAQSLGPVFAENTICSGVTLNAATATNLSSIIIDVRKQAKVLLSLSMSNAYTLQDANVNAAFFVQRGLNTTSWDTNGNVVSFLPKAGLLVTYTTNLDTYGCGYMRVLWLTNQAQATTNFTFVGMTYGTKIQAP